MRSCKSGHNGPVILIKWYTVLLFPKDMFCALYFTVLSETTKWVRRKERQRQKGGGISMPKSV
jgi:hypothetical protein